MIRVRRPRVKYFLPRAPVLYSAPMDGRFMKVYELLRHAHGPRRWWPVTPPGETKPLYTGGPRSDLQRFEVAVGAILTQNTAWSNAARAIENLNRLGAMSPEAIERMDVQSLAARDTLRRLFQSEGEAAEDDRRLVPREPERDARGAARARRRRPGNGRLDHALRVQRALFRRRRLYAAAFRASRSRGSVGSVRGDQGSIRAKPPAARIRVQGVSRPDRGAREAGLQEGAPLRKMPFEKTLSHVS